MFGIDAPDEEITKSKKRILLGLFILLGLVAALGPWLMRNEAGPPQVAGADITVTETTPPPPAVSPTSWPATPTASPPAVTPPSLPEATAIAAAPAPEQIEPGQTAVQNSPPETQASDGEEIRAGGESTAESAGEAAAVAISGAAEGQTPGTPRSAPAISTAVAPDAQEAENDSQASAEASAESEFLTGSDDTSDGKTGYGPIISPGATSGGAEVGPEQDSGTAPDLVSPGDLPTTGLGGPGWGMTWLALGVILVLIGVGVTSASGNYSKGRD